ncbi:MAG: Glu/Leu/Phe/Val dehydrogenase [Bacteroidia bacterium]|nr:Glu/Leu/Phe/Val dehydrogenase [Bacteroidia bacterium]
MDKTRQQEAGVLAQMGTYDHEEVLFCNDNALGLRSIIAVHSTRLGPSLGGTRMWNYTNEQEALTDALRLSRGMTYKAAVAGLPLGGGKAVIIGDSRSMKSEKLFRRFGQFVESLNGRYITAEDVGIGPADMVHVSRETRHVTGLPGKSGDPSPVTAYGVYMAMKAAAKKRWGSDSLAGKKVAVQGVGHVGEGLVGHLMHEGAIVSITDIFEDRIREVSSKFKVQVVGKDDIFGTDADIYAPCALGATVNDRTIEQFKCSIICGAANNQLAEENVHGRAIEARGIIYTPDYVANGGGLMNVCSEITGVSREKVMEQAKGIYDTVLKIFAIAEREKIPSYLAANRLAEERLSGK